MIKKKQKQRKTTSQPEEGQQGKEQKKETGGEREESPVRPGSAVTARGETWLKWNSDCMLCYISISKQIAIRKWARVRKRISRLHATPERFSSPSDLADRTHTARQTYPLCCSHPVQNSAATKHKFCVYAGQKKIGGHRGLRFGIWPRHAVPLPSLTHIHTPRTKNQGSPSEER